MGGRRDAKAGPDPRGPQGWPAGGLSSRVSGSGAGSFAGTRQWPALIHVETPKRGRIHTCSAT